MKLIRKNYFYIIDVIEVITLTLLNYLSSAISAN